MRFVVATDGSTQSDEAIDHAIDIATKTDASLTAVHAVDPDVYEHRADEPIADLSDAQQRLVIEDIEDAERRGRRILDDAAAMAQERGCGIDTELLYGDPAETIARYATRDAVDGIFVGHRDLSADHRRVLGSVTKQLIDHAPVPVTVVR